MLFYFYLLYLHNILCSKNVYFHIHTLNLQTFQMSLNYFFPLKKPINPETLILGSIDTGIWIWSLHTFASMISTPFHSHNILSIFPISFFLSPYISFLLYLGANTI
ncbi:hypothetical protein CTC_02437 [Clostridium tetani E88]|uniref:Uncharacterized protein n=1 Tax=Clostridium tetani (strain Massachusetts / E88) TaxID=212717 RepID=Q891E2_CLOTE|nr:hypothetical protein CTC_02437 [Clostridium tetani E88]